MPAEPEIGQDVYVPTSLYLTHGRDDFRGGLCRIVSIHEGTVAGDGPYVEVEECPEYRHNWRYLMAHQDEWRREYGDRRGYPDPDLRPEFNEE